MKRYILISAAFCALFFAGCHGAYIDPGLNDLGSVPPGNNAGNNNGKDDTNSGTIDSAIVAKWYATQEAADSGTGTPISEYTADGKWFSANIEFGTFSTKDGVLTLSASLGGTIVYDYEIDGTKLFLTLNGQEQSLSSTFYKKSTDNNNNNDDDSGPSDSSIIGKWYTQTEGGASATLTFEFRADGKWLSLNTEAGTFSASGGKLTFRYTSGAGNSQYNYKVEGTKLTMTYPGTTTEVGVVYKRTVDHTSGIIDDERVLAKWYYSQNDADNQGRTPVYEFNADGTCGGSIQSSGTFSVKDRKIMTGSLATMIIYDYTIDGTELTIAYVGGEPHTYYKKAD